MIRHSSLVISLVSLAICNPFPQFFSLDIGFGSDSSPLTFHTQDASQPAAPSQQSSFQQQPSFQPQSSFQPQPSFQPQSSFQPSPVTAAPPPARSAPAPPMFSQQANQRDNSFRQSNSQLNVFAAPTQPSVPQIQRTLPRDLPNQQQTQDVNNAKTHEEALARNALHRQQLASVIETHNKKTFSQFENHLREVPKVASEEINEDNKNLLSVTRRPKIPAKRPVEIANFLGRPTPSTKAPRFLTKSLPDSIRNELLEHLELINSLDEQVNELVEKAARVFSTSEDFNPPKRKPYEEERRKTIPDSEEENIEISEYETEIE